MPASRPARKLRSLRYTQWLRTMSSILRARPKRNRMIAKVCTFPLRCVEGLQGRSAAAYRESAWLGGLPTLKLLNQRCHAQHFEIAGFLFGQALILQLSLVASDSSYLWDDCVEVSHGGRLGKRLCVAGGVECAGGAAG